MTNSNPIGRCRRCGAEVHFKDERCPECGAKNDCWVAPDHTQCGNCHAHLDEGDRYCRKCGTKVGDGAFEPYQQIIQCIYGPMPVERTHICEQCGYTWTTCQMIDRDEFCPKCGGKAPATERHCSKII